MSEEKEKKKKPNEMSVYERLDDFEDRLNKLEKPKKAAPKKAPAKKK